MDVDENYKAKIENKIVDLMIQGVEKGEVSEADLPEISNFVLASITPIKNYSQMDKFLSELSKKWPLFKSIEKTYKGELKSKVEAEIIQGTLVLAREGKIEEALQLAKKGTQ